MITVLGGRYTKEQKNILLYAFQDAVSFVCDYQRVHNGVYQCELCPPKYKRVCDDLRKVESFLREQA